MKGTQVKVEMIVVKPKMLEELQGILPGSVEDSENLIVRKEELETFISEIEGNNELEKFLKSISEDGNNEIEYVWFYI